jgi:hypothetical protein
VSLTEGGVKALEESLPGWRAAQARFVKAVGSEFWLGFRSELERLANVAVELEAPPANPGQAAPVVPSS